MLRSLLRRESASSALLLLGAVIAFAWANLDSAGYRAFFDAKAALRGTSFTLKTVIDDGLMTFFFLVIGTEIKHELVTGELSTWRAALLPGVAALGGMVVPAGIFLSFNWGGDGQRGWGVPTATDVAFCVGVLALLKERVPRGLIAFVTALAVFDDIGGILLIAVFYGRGVEVGWLLGAAGLSVILFAMNRLRVERVSPYVLVGIGLWYALHHGGIHPTMAGVLVGLMVPAKAHALQPFADLIVLPAFALANAGVVVTDVHALGAAVSLGTALGLFAGKAIGIFGTTALAVRAGLAPMPGNSTTRQLLGASTIAGIGFTVAIFIAGLAYANKPELLDQAKLGIVAGSLASGVVGSVILALRTRGS